MPKMAKTIFLNPNLIISITCISSKYLFMVRYFLKTLKSKPRFDNIIKHALKYLACIFVDGVR